MPQDATRDTSTSSKTGAGSLTSIIIPALFTLLGVTIGVLGNGFYGLRLERAKADTDLVKLAIQSPDEKTRIETLQFMVGANLIQDAEIRNGVLNYLPKTPQNSEKVVPQVVPSGSQMIFPSGPRVLASGDTQLEFVRKNFSKLIAAGVAASVRARPLFDDTRPKTNEVRIFHLEDKQQAERIARALKDTFGIDLPDVRMYNDADAQPGYIEIWIARVPQ